VKPSPKKTNAADKISDDSGASRTRIVIVDGQGSTRGFFRTALSRMENYAIVGEGRTGTDALQLCRKFEPAVLIMELMLRDMSAATVVAELRAENSPTRALIFTGSHNEAALLDALRMRPHGFVHKDESFPALWNALSTVARGGCSISPFVGPLHDRALAGPPSVELTSRERAVLQMIAEGQPNKAIGDAIGVSFRTIDHNRRELMKKLSAHDIATLTRIAVRMGLVQ
jgi:two-component system secretion response regulator SsrB